MRIVFIEEMAIPFIKDYKSILKREIMAGGKETPRQKMIGMMYLVLTALLALNVSKQIVSAFITINNKLENSASVIQNKTLEAYGEIDKKRAGIVAVGGSLEEFKIWESKSQQLKTETSSLIDFLLGESNDMIAMSEGVDWVEKRDENDNIVKLKPLDGIQGMDNYDIPTNMFVGGNPENPNERGQQIITKIHTYRDVVCELMGTYSTGTKSFSFTAPSSIEGLSEALTTCNEEDSSAIAQFYRTLTIPEKLHAHGEADMLPWASVTFDHAPIVAAAAMFTSLRLDVQNAETMVAEYIVDKIKAPIFNFNKIEPMTLAGSAYINQGDSLPLNVQIAAYDSNQVSMIRWGMDADTLPEKWQEVSGGINLSGAEPGAHKVKGAIGVRERGEIKWKNWEFDYTVGQPMGVVAQPDMRVLYIGYDNVVEATASGFPPENVSMSGSGCNIVKLGNKYVAKVSRGTRNATISVKGKNPDGSIVSVGSYQYKCVPLPDAQIKIGNVKSGDDVAYNWITSINRLGVKFPEGVNLDGKFDILEGSLQVGGVTGKGKINAGGGFGSGCQERLRQSRGKSVSIIVKYQDQSKTIKKTGITLNVRP